MGLDLGLKQQSAVLFRRDSDPSKVKSFPSLNESWCGSRDGLGSLRVKHESGGVRFENWQRSIIQSNTELQSSISSLNLVSVAKATTRRGFRDALEIEADAFRNVDSFYNGHAFTRERAKYKHRQRSTLALYRDRIVAAAEVQSAFRSTDPRHCIPARPPGSKGFFSLSFFFFTISTLSTLKRR